MTWKRGQQLLSAACPAPEPPEPQPCRDLCPGILHRAAAIPSCSGLALSRKLKHRTTEWAGRVLKSYPTLCHGQGHFHCAKALEQLLWDAVTRGGSVCDTGQRSDIGDSSSLCTEHASSGVSVHGDSTR